MFQKLAFGNHFLCSCFKSHICECFNFSSCNFKMNKNSVKYLQGIIFFFNPPTTALAEKTKVKNLGHAAPDSFISEPS